MFAGPDLILFGIAVLVVWIAAAVVIAAAAVRRAESRRCALLGVMATAAERLIPLGPAVEAFARERRGPLAFRGERLAFWAGRLAQLIEAGVPLPEALRHCGGLLPRDAAPMIRIGYESGALAPALRQAASAHSREDPLWSSLTGKLVYLCVLPWFFLGVLSFVMLKIVPSFVKIFADFDVRLPAVTRLLIAACTFLADFWPLWGLLWLAAFAVLFYAVLRYIGWIRFDPPGIDRLVRRRHTAVTFKHVDFSAGVYDKKNDAVRAVPIATFLIGIVVGVAVGLRQLRPTAGVVAGVPTGAIAGAGCGLLLAAHNLLPIVVVGSAVMVLLALVVRLYSR